MRLARLTTSLVALVFAYLASGVPLASAEGSFPKPTYDHHARGAKTSNAKTSNARTANAKPAHAKKAHAKKPKTAKRPKPTARKKHAHRR